jgi:hypothetical protein
LHLLKKVDSVPTVDTNQITSINIRVKRGRTLGTAVTSFSEIAPVFGYLSVIFLMNRTVLCPFRFLPAGRTKAELFLS